LKGLSIAALTAAIVASLAGKANSISTIFTLDVYKKYLNKDAGEAKLVWVGRATIIIAMVVGILFTWSDLLGIGGEGGFTFIQKYTGFISPGIFAMFILGMFWKRTSGAAAIIGILVGLLASVFFNNHMAISMFGTETWFYTAFPNGKGGYEIPFLVCMGLSFLFTVISMVLVSLAGPAVNPKAFVFEKGMFLVKPATVVMIVITLLLLSALYVRFW
jgi:SSS family solute:Na+ symporter